MTVEYTNEHYYNMLKTRSELNRQENKKVNTMTYFEITKTYATSGAIPVYFNYRGKQIKNTDDTTILGQSEAEALFNKLIGTCKDHGVLRLSKFTINGDGKIKVETVKTFSAFIAQSHYP